MLAVIISVIPALLVLCKWDSVRPISIYFVSGHMNEWGADTVSSASFKHVQCPHGVSIKIIEGDSRRTVVRGLCSCMDDEIRANFADQSLNTRAIADVPLMMLKFRNSALQPLLVPKHYFGISAS